MKLVLALLLLSSQCYGVEVLKAEGQVKAVIVAQETAEVTADSGTVVYAKDGTILGVIL